MNTQIFQYNGNPVTFQLGNRDLMVNATEMAKPFDKRPIDYLRLSSTNELIRAKVRKSHIDKNQLVITERGGSNPGTWFHEDIALDFAQWLSVDFRLWCNDRIKELLRHGITATQPTIEKIIDDPDNAIKLLMALKEERLERQKLAELNVQAHKQVAALAPKAELMDKVLDTDQKIDVGQAAKILNLPFGRNTLFQRLRERGIFFCNRNEPKQEYINRGYFELKEKLIDRNNHESFTVIKVLVTQKGLDFLARQFEVVQTPKKMAPIK